jgi:hypothetical protein
VHLAFRWLLAAALLLVPLTAAAQTDPVINEFVFNHTGTDAFEYVEVFGDAATDYSAFTVLEIEGDSTGAGVIDGAFPVGTTNATGHWFTGFFGNVIENGTVTLLLVEGFTGTPGTDLDTDNDGLLDAAPWSRLVDSVAVTDGGSSDHAYSPAVLAGGFDGVSFTPGGASRFPDGTDTDSAADWVRNDFDGAGIPALDPGTPDPGEAFNTPEAVNAVIPAVAADPVINEFVANHTGTDNFEYVEVAGDPTTDYSAFTVLEIEGDSSGAGVIDGVFPVGTTNASGTWFTGFLSNQIENGTVTFLLVEGFSGSAGTDLDPDNDGTLDTMPWDRVVDSVAVTDGGSSDRAYSAVVLAGGFDGVPFTPGGASRIPNGTDTDSVADWVRNDFDGAGIPGLDPGTPEAGEAVNTPDDRNRLVPTAVVINEVDADTPGTDTAEFVELIGPAGAPLDGLVVVFYNGNGDASYAAFDLDGFSLDAGGFFVLGNAGVPNVGLVFGSNGLQNGADAVAVYEGDAVDFPNGTPVTAAGLVDALVYDTNDGDDPGLLSVLTPGQPQVNEGGGGNSSVDSNSRVPDGGAPFDTSTYVQQAPTPGASNVPLVVLAEIFEIQGPGLTSPLVGQVVETADNTVTAVAPTGFFIQTPDERADADPETSNGIFVFTSTPPAVAVGDRVTVVGIVQEFFDLTEISGSPAVTVLTSGNPLPAVVTFDAATPSPNQPQPATELERFEGMLVRFENGLATGPSDRFGDLPVVASSQRAFREPGIMFPGLPGLPVWDGNPEVFEVDPDGLGGPDAAVNAGTEILLAEGPLTFSFGDYQILPKTLVLGDAPPLPRPVPPALPDELTVGSLNFFRLFDDVDDPGPEDNGQVATTAEYQRRLAKFSLYIREVLGAPDVLAVEEVESLSVLEDVAARLAYDDPGLAYSAFLEEGNDVGGIDVGFLVSDRVRVDAVTQLGADEIFSFDGSLLHDRPPLLLEGALLTGGEDFLFQVMAVHNRSLSGIDDPADGPRVRLKRLDQAQSIAEKVQAIQTAGPAVRLVVTGDFNAFQFTDGYVDAVGQIRGDFVPADNLLSGPDLVDPNLTNQVLSLPADEQYSFVFDGSAQVLDHALTTVTLDPLVTGFEYGRGNADAAAAFLGDGTTALRSSDHDGLVLYVFADSDADGIANSADLCPGTGIPEAVPTVALGVNRWALVDGDGVFDTTPPAGRGPEAGFTLEDTAGCSCEQILAAQGLGQGHEKFGCSTGVMQVWVAGVSP